MTILELSDVCYTYDKGTPMAHEALVDINLKIEKGLMTGIIGHTGCGKSTMLRMFNGLLKPDSGKVVLDGQDIWAKPKEISQVRFKVGLVMQYPEYQLFDETVRADIAYGPRNMGLGEDEISKRVKDAAAFTGIAEDMLDRSPFELSGGQKRRVAIAGIMAMKPDVLVLDEPAAGLDPKGREDIFLGLDRYRRESGASVIIVSHSMEDMARYCDRLVVMNDGRIYLEGTQKEVFGDAEKLMKIGLGVPEVTRLISHLREGGMPVPQDIYTVDDAKAILLSLLGGDVR
ncbi:MAG: energy-coupling factor transporter ATPase [Clostridia bacterium]|nr:energy-coupling factor transporter ATPase [Clostridia bacterium]MBQ6893268.1 energy-coupling factor transporter ATPase [Clostridia bacterium]